MQVLTDLTLDKLINLYVGIVTHDKKPTDLPAKRVDPIEESNFFDGESNPKMDKKRTLPAIYGKECLFV